MTGATEQQLAAASLAVSGNGNDVSGVNGANGAVPGRVSSPAPAGAAHYDLAIDPAADTTHAKVVRLVGEGRRVLELGTAGGHMTRVLHGCGCRVIGVELDPEVAARAAAFAERMIVGDLDVLDLARELGDERFDVIVAADVLEHLKDPAALLRTLHGYLRPDGYVVASLPNVAHGSVRLALLGGRFPYGEVGLLDRTHLRFYTLDSLARLFEEAGYALGRVDRQELAIDASEVHFDPAAVPAELLDRLARDQEARTYQFIVVAYPLPARELGWVQVRIREAAEARADAEREAVDLRRRLDERVAEVAPLQQTVEEQAAHLAALRARVDALTAQKDEVRIRLLDAHDQLIRRDEELDRLRTEAARFAERERERAAHERERQEAEREQRVWIEGLQRELVARERHAADLQAALDRILGSPPGRFYRALRGVLTLGRR